LASTPAPAFHRFSRTAGMPPVGVTRIDQRALDDVEPGHAHSHDFLVLAYFERGGGSITIGQGDWDVRAGDAFVVAPGEIVGVGDDPTRLARARGWALAFPPEGVGAHAADAVLQWRAHPLLLAFARGATSGAHRLRVPAPERGTWSAALAAIDRELCERRDGFREAVVAQLTLILVAASRLAGDIVGDLRLKDEPLLAEVFGVIEARYRDPISLRDVAAKMGLTPGHLTTVVRKKTGRPVLDWINERRMSEARRLLVATDETVAEVGRSVGFSDPVYFARCFRREHGMSPLRWRRAARG
jgi:AraC family transcriptional activator of pobA